MGGPAVANLPKSLSYNTTCGELLVVASAARTTASSPVIGRLGGLRQDRKQQFLSSEQLRRFYSALHRREPVTIYARPPQVIELQRDLIQDQAAQLFL